MEQSSAIKNAVYTGQVTHTRVADGPSHSLSYRVALAFVNLNDIEGFMANSRLFSSRFPAPLWFRRSDFLGDPSRSLYSEVADLVRKETGAAPEGEIAMLANIRSWGWLFNPITLYFCFDASGQHVDSLVAEVENTPWHERVAYVFGPPGQYRVAKKMHVSPFLPMDVDYLVNYTSPGEGLKVTFDVVRGEEDLLHAGMVLQRLGTDRRSIRALLFDVPAMTYRVTFGIYANAARLLTKGIRFYPHPKRRALRRLNEER